MRVGMFGDVVGKIGRSTLRTALPDLVDREGLDVVIVNGENIAGGNGITPALAQDLWSTGVDVITSGDHIWDKKEIEPFIDRTERLLRPLNYPPGTPGQGLCIVEKQGWAFGVLNLLGRVFMNPMDCPFRAATKALAGPLKDVKAVFVDFHCEATSEKNAMGWHLDGRVTATVGTHTHVQTADERLLPGGMAYITDLGLTGARDGIIGVNKPGFLYRFKTGRRGQRGPEKGDGILCGVIIDVDAETGQAQGIRRVAEVVPEKKLLPG